MINKNNHRDPTEWDEFGLVTDQSASQGSGPVAKVLNV